MARCNLIEQVKEYDGIEYLMTTDSKKLFPHSITTEILGVPFSSTLEDNMIEYINRFYKEPIQEYQKDIMGVLYKFERSLYGTIDCYLCSNIGNRVNLKAVPPNKLEASYMVHWQYLNLIPMKDSNWI